MDIRYIGQRVRARREEIGLTQERLARLSQLSRETVQRLEAGTLKDLGFQRVGRLLRVLGLDFDSLSLEQRKRKHGLWMAAQTASVSYRGTLSPEMLEEALTTGNVPSGFEPHIGHLLDEAPVEVLVMAVEETAANESLPPAMVWKQVSRLAADFATTRRELWA
ncbi:helix-turn-helix domain-containing protein [Cupriavidus sp. AU9028]|uniref:helix-turn-helix domain-containing protein n=1 Tax=Cupriavidus sp. AU9028 TaxID=2871157 RepID=UPI001C948CCC|nr:helix-turn-helix domain-containing protein [Cupriavidus sp. AU9028]MBY4897678.1 helix-turn-helix transcriptional regulator [Cupriavidus sp. AU9028]